MEPNAVQAAPELGANESSPGAQRALVAGVAGGAGVVFGAELIGRGLRLAATWYLSGALGAAMFGRWASAVTVLVVATAVVPLGLDLGMTYVGARHLGRGEHAQWKGALQRGLLLVVSASVAAGGLWWWGCHAVVARWRAELAGDLVLLAPGVASYGVLLFAVGVLRAYKDMRAQALSFQLCLPALTLLGALTAVQLGWGLPGVLRAFVVAIAGSTVLACWQAWRLTRDLWLDRSLPSRHETAALLRWSLPQSLESTLFRANQWMDLLMLTALAAPAVVGGYRVALALALLCQVPVLALVTMLNPVVAELAGRRALDTLQGVLRASTRWLLLLLGPIVLGVVLVPDLPLMVFDDAYGAAIPALRVLVVGVAVFAACAPTHRLLPMAGWARTNLANHIWVVGLNAAANLLFIPRLGMIGAALATSVSLVLWSLVVLFQVRHLLGCWAWDRRNAVQAALVVALTVGAFGLFGGQGLGVRLAVTVGCAVLLVVLVAWQGLAPDDRYILDAVVTRLRRRLVARSSEAA